MNTARGLEEVLGPKYKRQLDKRETECPEIEIYNYLINDDLHQELDKDQIINVINRIKKEMQAEKSSVLVHCAQVHIKYKQYFVILIVLLVNIWSIVYLHENPGM